MIARSLAARQLSRSQAVYTRSPVRAAPLSTSSGAPKVTPSPTPAASRRRAAPSWSHAVGSTALVLAAGATLLYSHALNDGGVRLQTEPRHDADADTKADASSDDTKSKRRNITEDLATLMCFVGYPQSGKSTQADNTQKEWAQQGWKVLKDINSVEELRDALHQATAQDGPLRFILDGFPRTLDEAKAVEQEIGDIFCYAFFHMEKDEWMKRTGRSAEEYETLKKTLEPLRNAPREKGNILEIAAHWPTAREVWEMVQAKVEQVFELHERGDM